MENLKYPWEQKWTSRNKLVAKYVKGKSVLDIGGGLCELKKYIGDVFYISLDIKEWTKDTIVVDLNDHLPDLNIKYDTVVCQGVSEYILDLPKFFSGIKAYGNYLILTYRKESSAVMPRNKYLQKDIIKMLENAGWKIEQILPSVSKKERLFLCKI